MRSHASLIAAVAAAFLLQAVLCPAICIAASADHASSPQEHASAPQQPPCHETGSEPAGGDARGGCDGDCSQLERAVLSDSAGRTDLDLPAVTFAVAEIGLLAPVGAICAGGSEPAPPPPRNLPLVKNSFLL